MARLSSTRLLSGAGPIESVLARGLAHVHAACLCASHTSHLTRSLECYPHATQLHTIPHALHGNKSCMLHPTRTLTGMGEDSVFIGLLEPVPTETGCGRVWVTAEGIIVCCDPGFVTCFGWVLLAVGLAAASQYA